VPAEFDGRGIGDRLAALDHAAPAGVTVVPLCPPLARAPPGRGGPATIDQARTRLHARAMTRQRDQLADRKVKAGVLVCPPGQARA
jgi:predicted GNAT family acetyltransferase